jgi:hypothetical protein
MVFLRSRRIIPAEKTSSPRLTQIEKCVQAYVRYLREERGLAGATIINYVPFIRRLLRDHFGKGRVILSGLCARDVVRFVQSQVVSIRFKRARVLTTALRSFLQYARYRGDITSDLAAAVPRVRTSFAMDWQHRCCVTALRLLKSANYWVITAPRLQRSMPRWISNHCGRLLSRGREVGDERTSRSCSRIFLHEARFGIQVERYG